MIQTRQVKQRLMGTSKKTKIIVAIGLLALTVIVWRNFYVQNTVNVPRGGEIKPAVDILKVARKDMMKDIDLTGQTVPVSQVDISTKYGGKITQVNVDLGQHVSEGQILVIQDTSDVDISLSQNDASLRQAEADALESNATFEATYQKAKADYQYSLTTYQRYKSLYDQGAISKETLDNAQQQMIAAKSTLDTWSNQLMAGTAASVESKRAARDKARSAIDGLENQKKDLILRAPRAGIIGYRLAEVGNMAQAGQKLLSIVDNSNIFVDCSVSEQDIGQMVTGMSVNVSLESLGKTYTGKIIYISPAMDTKTQNFTLRVALDAPDPSIKSGMFAKTKITVVLRPQTLFIPKEAVVSLNGSNRIFVVNSNNQVTERTVTMGLRNDKTVEITSGLAEGEQVAVSNLARLRTGLPILPNLISE